jgi:hypothetical protein
MTFTAVAAHLPITELLLGDSTFGGADLVANVVNRPHSE